MKFLASLCLQGLHFLVFIYILCFHGGCLSVWFLTIFYLAAVTNAASLIGCSVSDLMLALSTRQIQVGKDKVAKSLTMEQVNRSAYIPSLADFLFSHFILIFTRRCAIFINYSYI